jgi:hypothetical protein
MDLAITAAHARWRKGDVVVVALDDVGFFRDGPCGRRPGRTAWRVRPGLPRSEWQVRNAEYGIGVDK